MTEVLIASGEPCAIFLDPETRSEILVVNHRHKDVLISGRAYMSSPDTELNKSLQIWNNLRDRYSVKLSIDSFDVSRPETIINAYTKKIRESELEKGSEPTHIEDQEYHKDILEAFADIPTIVIKGILEREGGWPIKIDEDFTNNEIFTYALLSQEIANLFNYKQGLKDEHPRNNLVGNLLRKRASFSIEIFNFIKDISRKVDKFPFCEWTNIFQSPLEIWFLCEINCFILDLHEANILKPDKRLESRPQIYSETKESIRLLKNPKECRLILNEQAVQSGWADITIFDILRLTGLALTSEDKTYGDSKKQFTSNPTRDRSKYQISLKKMDEFNNFCSKHSNKVDTGIQDLVSQDGGVTFEDRSSVIASFNKEEL